MGNFLGLPLPEALQAHIRYLDAEALQKRIYITIGALLEAVAQTESAPLIVTLDDIHWIDQASLALIEYLLPLVYHVPLAFLFMYRPERTKPCWQIREKAEREFPQRATEIFLKPLPPESSLEMLGHLVGIDCWPEHTRTLAGEDESHVSGGYPVQPRVSYDVGISGTIAHGALFLGGTFTDVADFDPFVSRVVTDEIATAEPAFPGGAWNPAQLGTINRFLTVDAQPHERLVVVPGQFQTTSTGLGTERLYSEMDFLVYHAPFSDTDFTAPSIWMVDTHVTMDSLTFSAFVEDDSGTVARAVVLYRGLDERSWSLAELAPGSAAGWWTSTSIPFDREEVIEYVVQVVDPTGNVALALDHGNPFNLAVRWYAVYLPLVLK